MAFNREAHIIQQAVKGPKMTIVKQLKKQLSIVKVSLGQRYQIYKSSEFSCGMKRIAYRPNS